MLLEMTILILIGLVVAYYKYQKYKFKKRLQDPEYFQALVTRHDIEHGKNKRNTIKTKLSVYKNSDNWRSMPMNNAVLR
jgi:hypothetical protein